MFGNGGETPSRYELLSMVRKHSASLGKTTAGEGLAASDIEMDGRFWHDVFDLYFVPSKESRGQQDDDLIFFVRRSGSKGYSSEQNGDGDSPYFVRRWASQLDNVVGESLAKVDWRRSFYLNLIAHTSFTVTVATVAICSHQVLQNHQPGQDTALSPIYKVVKTVYASPSRVNFHLDSKKVLTDTDHCYCVILNALDGAAFPD